MAAYRVWRVARQVPHRCRGMRTGSGRPGLVMVLCGCDTARSEVGRRMPPHVEWGGHVRQVMSWATWPGAPRWMGFPMFMSALLRRPLSPSLWERIGL